MNVIILYWINIFYAAVFQGLIHGKVESKNIEEISRKYRVIHSSLLNISSSLSKRKKIDDENQSLVLLYF